MTNLKNVVKQNVIFKAVALFGLLFVLGCGPQRNNHAQQVHTPDIAIPEVEDLQPLELNLVTTYQKEIIAQKPDMKFETQDKYIQTKHAQLILDKVKMSNVSMKYDPKDKKLVIKGVAEIQDDNSGKALETPFTLYGTHNPEQDEITLTSDKIERTNSNSKPVVRARATCLGFERMAVSCSSAVIDFFIAHQKKIYTEQMEVRSQKTEQAGPAPQPITEEKIPEAAASATEPKTKPKVQRDSETGLQIESEEQSVLGRYQGTAESSDLKEIFKDDDDILSALNQTQVPVAQIPTAQASAQSQNQPPAENTEQKPVAESKDPTNKPAEVKKEDAKAKTDEKKQQEKKTETPTQKQEEKKQDENKPEMPVTPTTPSTTPVISNVGKAADGSIRPMNQARGLPYAGLLSNATSLQTRLEMVKLPLFEIAFPQRQRFFSTYEMAEIITRMGQFLNKTFGKKIILSDISRSRGGYMAPHKSHQNGMDADIAYPSNNDAVKFPVVVDDDSEKYDPSRFSIEQTYQLLKFTMKQDDIKIDRFFIDKKIKSALCAFARSKGETQGADKDLVDRLFKIIQHEDGHGDHFHMRLACTPAHPSCRKVVYVEQQGCK